MPSKFTLNVSLTDELRDFVADQVKSGRFRTASEVVRAALRLLERDVAAPISGRSDLPREALREAEIRKPATRAADARS